MSQEVQVNLQGANTLMGLPGLALDGHAHVFEHTLPMVSTRRYAPDRDALLSTYANHLLASDLDGGLLVQPSFLGTDNSYLQAALEAGKAQTFRTRDGVEKSMEFRGVVTLPSDARADQLAALTASGIIGMRFNLFGQPVSRFDIGPWRTLLTQISDLGWHVDLHCEGAVLAEVLPQLLDHASTVTVDHFGLPDTTAPLDCPGQQAILSAQRGTVFVKASGPYRVFRKIPSHEAARMCDSVFAQLHEQLGPQYMMWGSDWPWTQFEAHHSFGDTRHWLDDWLARSFDRTPYRVSSVLNQTPTEVPSGDSKPLN